MRAALGELPAALRSRLETTYGITPYDSDVLVNQGRELVDYFVDLADEVRRRQAGQQLGAARRAADPQRARRSTIDRFPLTHRRALAELLAPVKDGDVDTGRAREVLVEMIATGSSAAEVMPAHGIAKVDESELFALGQELIAANPKIVADIKAGKLQAASNLIGQAKKQNPNVSPGRFREIVIELVGKM